MKFFWRPLLVTLALMVIIIVCTPTETPSQTTSQPQTQSKSQRSNTQPTIASSKAKPSVSPSTSIAPQTGGILNIICRRSPAQFGYPPRITGGNRDYIPPIFNRLLSIDHSGSYRPELAISWANSADGKSITFKLRKGVKFHDGTDFNADAVKFNYDVLIPPKSSILSGVISVDVVDPYTVKINLSSYNILILYQLASAYECYIASPTAIQKNGLDWAASHPIGTGPFQFVSYEPNTNMKFTKNPNYWEKGLPYLDGIQWLVISDRMTQILTFQAGQANAIYDADPTLASQLQEAGYPVLIAPGAIFALSFDVKNNKTLSDARVRQAIEYAIDKEAICSGPGMNMYKPAYQVVDSASPSYNKACPPRKYNPAKAKRLLADAGYPNGFTLKCTFLNTYWKDGIVAIQSYLAQVGITLDVNMVSQNVWDTIRVAGKIEPGTGSQMTMNVFSNSLFVMDSYWRSNATNYSYIVKPAGCDDLIEKAEQAKDPARSIKFTQDITKLLYDEATIVPLWVNPRVAVLDKSVREHGWFINGDSNNNNFGRSTWMKK
jgi:peptide/nickel transport system substrate-binding protein